MADVSAATATASVISVLYAIISHNIFFKGYIFKYFLFLETVATDLSISGRAVAESSLTETASVEGPLGCKAY